MRPIAALMLFGLLVLATAGCNSTRWSFLRNEDNKLAKLDSSKVPSVAALVDYMNDNAGRVKSLQCNSLEVTCAQGVERINLHGKMVAEKPRGFRMSLDGPLGFTQVADLGSNNDEFWFWIKPQPGQKVQSYQ